MEERTGALNAFMTAFEGMSEQVRLWCWPEESRGAKGEASMHTKLVAADTSKALVGSANLTGHALRHNIEVGVLVRDSVQVRRLVGHFRSMMGTHGPSNACEVRLRGRTDTVVCGGLRRMTASLLAWPRSFSVLSQPSAWVLA